MRALVVDDEPQMVAIVSYALETVGFDTLDSRNAMKAWSILRHQQIDLVVLDVMLPDESGISLCTRIRSHCPSTAILLLTALGDVENRVNGLEAGADDYLAKPFSPKELGLRAQALTRRHGGTPRAPVDVIRGSLRFEAGTGRVFRRGTLLDLSETEAALLRVLTDAPGHVKTVRELLNEVWGTTASEGGRNMVKTSVYRLRRKLAAAGADPGSIIAVRGRGYTSSPSLIDDEN
ncbi:response regulator transcription factor [Cutibacterium avidum]|uniref:response regulator transcription factor n=1 Tax=Cutibacterium avidum TaxID=33010 RepID=UPI00192BEB55|nr:response regulator transcription factor [Cutibacterium avidum]QQY14440.1 response regulator transcription factor [Cutibacterium avidum]